MTVTVVCIILLDPNGDVFIAQRSDSGFWEFPGGKIEVGESEIEALRREIKEELNIDSTDFDFQYFGESKWFNGRKKIHLRAYMAKVGKRPEITLIDHLQFEWVRPLALSNWPMTPADQSLVQELMKWATKS